MTSGPFGRLVRWPARRFVVQAVLMVLALALICWYFGVDVWHSLLLGVVITTAAVAAWVLTTAQDHSDSWGRGVERARRAGSRHDVAELAWLLRGPWGRVSLTAQLRVKRIARHRLALHQLELENPADRAEVERLIGPTTVARLEDIGRRQVRLRHLLDCLDALDALDPMYYPVPVRRAGRRSVKPIQDSKRRTRE